MTGSGVALGCHQFRESVKRYVVLRLSVGEVRPELGEGGRDREREREGEREKNRPEQRSEGVFLSRLFPLDYL